MKDLNLVIQEALKEINFEEIAKAVAIENVKKAVQKSVEDQFSWGSKLKKELDAHLGKELSIDFSSIQLPEYRDFLLEQVNKSLVGFIGEDHAKIIRDHINETVVGESRDQIEFETFWEEVCKYVEDACEEGESEKYQVEFSDKEDHYGLSSKYHRLIISEKKDSYSRYSKDQSEVMYFAFSDGKIYHSRTNDSFELSSLYTWLKAIQFRKTVILNPPSDKSETFPKESY